MPTYEYECSKCGKKMEIFQNMSDKPLTKCPKCKGSIKRLISAGSGIIFKGSGFYATDYRKGSGSSPAAGNTCPKAAEGCKGCQG